MPPLVGGIYYQFIYLVVRFTNGVTGKVVIDNARTYRVEPFDATYMSAVIKYDGAFRHNTKMLQGYCDGIGFDFDFRTGFRLNQRVRIAAINPTYPGESVNILKSTGATETTFGQSTKVWELGTDPLPDYVHDCIRIMRLCNHFGIVDETQQLTEYVSTNPDYIPEWDKKGSNNLATVRFEIKKKNDNTKFNIRN
jgi:hypothetical protein